MIDVITGAALPDCMQHLSDTPEQLYIRSAQQGAFQDIMSRPRVAIIGSRKMSPYGQLTAERFASELAARGVVIVSGLAIGVDGIAHRAALQAGGLALAVLPSSVEAIYPRSHQQLAMAILQRGGALVSEYPAGTPALKYHFVARNRIVAGLCQALVIVEAAEQSGTLHTAGFAQDMNIDILAVPGNITSPTSAGTNGLIKRNKAAIVTCTDDILQYLKLPSGMPLHRKSRVTGSNHEEQLIIDLLERGVMDGNQLLAGSGLDVGNFNHHLTMMEITDKIRSLGANNWALG